MLVLTYVPGVLNKGANWAALVAPFGLGLS